MRIALVVALFVLLGGAGYWWFDDEWYGWLTGAGVFALRVGPMFLWRTVLRVVRRQILGILFLLLPGSCKQPLRTARFAIRKWCEELLGMLKRRWQESWLIRFAVLVPAIVALRIVASSSTTRMVSFPRGSRVFSTHWDVSGSSSTAGR